ncbi:unnamed protein product [Soboliphyme baturini]|uniref:Wiskott-Aldrich syndrome protein family member n=1 Tax=Soboliphyme baturini TaxID=241478 RepID=A0A183J165_9BILA|nr:unnamed protein product [Soboliphyme baturini]
MPLTKRTISPLNLCRNRLPSDITKNELECVANGTLANIIRQLSSLSWHAESIFGEIFHEAVKVEHKANTLCTRLDRLVAKVSQLDNASDEVSLKDLPLLKPFKSSMLIDQQSLSRHTMPSEMAEKYRTCDEPPELDKLNPYRYYKASAIVSTLDFRNDSKRALKFYTDPDYFFELWRCEMLKVSETPKRPKSVSITCLRQVFASSSKNHRS